MVDKTLKHVSRRMSLERRASPWCVCQLAISVPVRVWYTSKPRVVTDEREVFRRLQKIMKRQNKEQQLSSLTRLQSAWQALHQAESIRSEVMHLIKAYLQKETAFSTQSQAPDRDLFSPSITDKHRIREDQSMSLCLDLAKKHFPRPTVCVDGIIGTQTVNKSSAVFSQRIEESAHLCCG